IGVIFFSDKVEKFIPPKKGRKHILFIIREILGFEPDSNGTDLNMVMRYMTNAIKKRCTAFLISDFIDQDDYSKALQIANNKHDVVAIQVFDELSTKLVPVGLMKVRDPETGDERWIDTSSKKVRNQYDLWWRNLQNNKNVAFRQSGVDSVSLSTEGDYVKSLLQLFQKRRKF
ncbi:MAG: VWA domain-containing protein, partial [Bacteroidales bacterium]|nr:VWA domain-containing protein [Bacteroidales bacterium]